jgi:2-polyprenyl-3-methyl-5-hydroxy-6-metoxy-1,4-benzoquinol methylase
MYQYRWLPGGLVPPELLADLSALYSSHYGFWGEQGYKPGKRIHLPPTHIKEWLTSDSIIVWATFLGELVGYAIAIQSNIAGHGSVAWVTQLVVHEEQRQKDVGKTLLFSLWRFTDHFAWGILSANPYAIRALEKATRRRCLPVRIQVDTKQLLQLGRRTVPYVKAAKSIVVTTEESRIDTQFFLDHSELAEMLKAVVNDEHPWQLGPLPEGWEWFAFTFKNQPQISLTPHELEEMLDASDQVTKEAYSRMQIVSGKHRWAQHSPREAEFIISNCQLSLGQTVVDFGCGPGRHTSELASRGLQVTGVDYVKLFIDQATEAVAKLGKPIRLEVSDCRTVDLGQAYDAAICLYDVIGSYADENSNLQLLSNLSKHVKGGGFVLLSVMNMGITRKFARNWFTVSSDADRLLELKPSNTMEKNGEIFNPEFYMIDEKTGIVYRKEQFKEGDGLHEEFIVRDRRYTENQIRSYCEGVGLEVIWSRFVKAGKWDEGLPSDEGKEILVLCKKPKGEETQRNLFEDHL